MSFTRFEQLCNVQFLKPLTLSSYFLAGSPAFRAAAVQRTSRITSFALLDSPFERELWSKILGYPTLSMPALFRPAPGKNQDSRYRQYFLFLAINAHSRLPFLQSPDKWVLCIPLSIEPVKPGFRPALSPQNVLTTSLLSAKLVRISLASWQMKRELSFRAVGDKSS